MPEAAESPEDLAVQVADGRPVDWEAALKSASDDGQRRILRHLRLVESVARVHRSSGPIPVEMTETIDAPPPTKWGPLELRSKLGQGAFGEVFLAWDPRLEREVALKLLTSESATAVHEGRLLAKLRHPNVVTVYGAEAHEGRVGLWMELIRGRSLEQLLAQQGPSGAREAAMMGIDLCRALAAVHGAGVVHRDVKAENAMRESGGRIVLTDFGAGIDVGGEGRDREHTISGTPFYMAPELFRGEPASRRTDLYALGVLLYRLVTGSFPLQASSWKELRERHARGEGKLLRDQRSDLPEAFVAAVERATAARPEDRFATAGQMEQALAASLGAAGAPAPVPVEGGSTRRRAALWTGVAVAAAAGIAGALLIPPLLREPEARPQIVAPAVPASATATAPYTVEAALYRTPVNSTQRQRLDPGARLALGDQLVLEVKGSTPLHVYVINEDEAGHAFALFPLPDLRIQNPLPPGETHVLPGPKKSGSRSSSWVVDTPGGREHLIVLASPTRLVEFEAEMNALARPSSGAAAVAIPDAVKVVLRGIGGLEESRDARPASGEGSAEQVFEMAQRLASRSEVAQGVWMRQIELESPKP